MPRSEDVEGALVADATLAAVGMDRDGELTVRLKIALTEPFDLNALRAWVHHNLRLYLVKPKTELRPIGASNEHAQGPF